MIWYVYSLARSVKVKRHIEWRVFYVGKGSKRRVFDHEREAQKGHKCHKCNIIRKVLREGGEIQRYILLTTEDETEALTYEIEMIALHGRENLVNKTDGGEGTTGRLISNEERQHRSDLWADPGYRAKALAGIHSPEARAAASASIRKTMARAEYRRARSVLSQSLWDDPEWRVRQTEIIRKGNADPERRARISKAGRGRTITEQHRARISEANKGRENPNKGVPLSPEHRQRISEGRRGIRPSPESVEKTRRALTGRKLSPEVIERMRQGHIGLKRSDETRARMSESQRGRVISEEHRQKLSEAAKRQGGRRHSEEALQKIRESNRAIAENRATYRAFDPEGNTHDIVRMKPFCKEHKLDYRSVQRATGTGKIYAGWRFERI